jgi:cytochrome c oxidase subunit 2
VDASVFLLIAITAFFTIGIVAAIFFFVVKYREKEKYATGAEIHGSMALETTWSIIPFIISMTIFLGGAVVYYNQYRMPADAMEVYVVGKQWMWKFQHGTGQREINELHVPVGRKVKLTMTTEDVCTIFLFRLSERKWTSCPDATRRSGLKRQSRANIIFTAPNTAA